MDLARLLVAQAGPDGPRDGELGYCLLCHAEEMMAHEFACAFQVAVDLLISEEVDSAAGPE